MKPGDLGVVVRVIYKESLATMRSWFSGDQSGDSYVALLEDNEMHSSSGLPLVEGKSPPRARSRCTRWNPKEALRLFWVLLPSFVARAFGHADDNSMIPAANETSYLNGLRGIASLIVAIQHNTDEYLRFIRGGWVEGDKNQHLIQLPFIRLLTSGIFMVTIFFTISGFALTYGPLKKAHGGQSADAIGSLPSSIFRRPFRLFLPVIPVLAATMVMIHFRAFYLPNRNDPMPAVADGVWAQALFLWRTLVIIMTHGATNTILPQSWTLSDEYKGSLFVFLCCMAFARVSPRVRIPSLLLLLVFILNLGMWQQCLFISGMLLADIRHVRKKLPGLTGTAHSVTTVASWLLFVFALFFGGWPTVGNGYAAAGYSWFTWVPTAGIEPVPFFLSVAAVALVAALENLPVLQRGLNARWVLYLGEISYSLYLVHWAAGKCPFTKGVTLRLLQAGHSITVAWAVGFIITMLLAIWLGDLHWRLVDKKSVRFAQWLSKKLGI